MARDETQNIPSTQNIQDSSSIVGGVPKATSTLVNGSKIHSVHRTASQPISTSHNASQVLANKSVSPLQRQSLTTIPAAPSTDEVSLGEEKPSLKQPIHQRRVPHRTFSAPTPSAITSRSGMEKSSLGKRKRKEIPLKYVPEAQQIFLGCNFFFIPNDDIAPMRRARIRKTQEHGARRISTWDEDITHIIVDKSLSYKDIISFLKVPSIPTTMIMVNDTYPIDCVLFKAILDPKQKQYRVKGHEQALEEKAPQKSSSQTSNTSLQLKPTQSRPGKWDYVPPRGTPPSQ